MTPEARRAHIDELTQLAKSRYPLPDLPDNERRYVEGVRWAMRKYPSPKDVLPRRKSREMFERVCFPQPGLDELFRSWGGNG